MRVMGPLTCVMACVVWSASQSTVPVVCMATAHFVFPTTAVFRWLDWSAVSVNIPGCWECSGSDLPSTFWTTWQAGCEAASSSPRHAGPRKRLRKRGNCAPMANFSYLNCNWFQRRGELDGGRRAGGAEGELNVVGRRHFGGGGEPDHRKYGRQAGRTAGFQKMERPHVAEEAAMIGGVVRFGLPDQRGKLRDTRHAQQEHDKQCFAVVEELMHYGNGLTVFRCGSLDLGYQNRAASRNARWTGQEAWPWSLAISSRPRRMGGACFSLPSVRSSEIGRASGR